MRNERVSEPRMSSPFPRNASLTLQDVRCRLCSARSPPPVPSRGGSITYVQQNDRRKKGKFSLRCPSQNPPRSPNISTNTIAKADFELLHVRSSTSASLQLLSSPLPTGPSPSLPIAIYSAVQISEPNKQGNSNKTDTFSPRSSEYFSISPSASSMGSLYWFVPIISSKYSSNPSSCSVAALGFIWAMLSTSPCVQVTY
jgi:hypothetical protein